MLLEQIDADPQAIAAQLEEEAEMGERTDVAPSLAPDAKAALLAAYEESRELSSSYVGPRARAAGIGAGHRYRGRGPARAFRRLPHEAPGAVIRGVEGGAPKETSQTPKLDEFGRDLTSEAREESSTR